VDKSPRVPATITRSDFVQRHQSQYAIGAAAIYPQIANRPVHAKGAQLDELLDGDNSQPPKANG
jgi:hypothetical protein